MGRSILSVSQVPLSSSRRPCTDVRRDLLPDENPTPPHSPNPVVHITPPGAKYPIVSTHSRVFSFEDSVFDRPLRESSKAQPIESVDPLHPSLPLSISISRPRSPFLPSLPSYSDIPPTPPAVKTAFPSLPSTTAPPTETLAERRASLGKLSNRALLSLQMMRLEASDDAGMGLGVGPPSAGYEGSERISPGQQPGKQFQLAMGIENAPGPDHTVPLVAPRSPLLAAYGVDAGSRPLQRSRSTGSLRSPRTRSAAQTNRPNSFYSPSSPGLAPDSPFPASPIVKRSSAFVTSNNGPLTPLTPSHIPGAPSLGAGSSAFEWFSYSAPESPVSPSFPATSQQKFISQPVQLPLTPTSESGSITPTGSGSKYRGGKIPASPLGRDRFSEESTSTNSNPFFVRD